jgi:predicted amidohydrolase
MSRLFGIAGVQMSVVPWNTEATLQKMIDVSLNIARTMPWAQMIVFHELAVTGLAQFVSAPTPDTWRQSAQAIPGPLTAQLCDLARKLNRWLVPGSMHELDGDKLYNTALVISPEGKIVTKYRKMFPWMPYEVGITAGNEFCVFDIPDVGRFGLCICYDQWFPEVARSLMWLGAEVILQPTLTPTSDRALEVVVSQANAIFNQCYFVGINGVGPYGGGKSIIVDPDGRVLQQVGDHDMVLTEILDLDHVTRTREYGNIGMTQTLKQLRDSGQTFPIYTEGVAQGEGFKKLGRLGLHRELRVGAPGLT